MSEFDVCTALNQRHRKIAVCSCWAKVLKGLIAAMLLNSECDPYFPEGVGNARCQFMRNGATEVFFNRGALVLQKLTQDG